MSNWSTADIPAQTGRTAIVTGANTGLGFEIALALARAGAHVVLAVRNLEKGKLAAGRIIESAPKAVVTLQEVDLSSLASVRKAAQDLRSQHSNIHLLINNAGVAALPKGTTKDGFESHFATNHLGPFALTGLLLDRLQASTASRVVTVTSMGHRFRGANHFHDLSWEQGYTPLAAYNWSKLANLLFTYELQRRLAPFGNTIAVAAHPGAAVSDLIRTAPKVARWFATLIFQSTAAGALQMLRAATDPGVLGGQFYGPDRLYETRGHPRVLTSSAQSYDLDLQRRLWAASEQMTKVVYPIATPQ